MTLKQFNTLQIGDMVMNSNRTAEIPVSDINRNRGLICTGGSWRNYIAVRLPRTKELPVNFTVLEPVTHITFSVKMINRFALAEAAIILTVLRAGDDGFVGTNETLCAAAQVCVSAASANIIIPRLCKEGILRREPLAHSATRYHLNRQLIEEYL